MSRIAAELFFIFLFLVMSWIGASVANIRYYDCGPNDTVSNFTYLNSDLNILFSSLRSDAKSSFGFSNTSVSDNGTANVIYGLIMCYKDATSDDCSACLDFSISDATTLCPGSSSAVLIYDWCFLRYEDHDFISSVNFTYIGCLTSTYSVSDSISVGNRVSYLLKSEILNLDPRYLYAYDNITDTGIHYSVSVLVQCTRHLLLADCDLCLQYAIGNMSGFSMGYASVLAKIHLMSCYVSYELNALQPSPSDKLTPDSGSSESKSKLSVVVAICASCAFFITVAGVVFCRWKQKKHINAVTDNGASDTIPETPVASLEFGVLSDFRVFQLSELKLATNMFSDENKLGEGGFGPVFKGALCDGKEIAVKRLAGWSKQGIIEFKNEVDLLAKLRHKNLVTLLGYCLDKNEKLLCYEYLPSGSLDWILFATDEIDREKLSWQARFKIIEGISTGLHYLHAESGLKIIHRDLKPSNILLHENMNPKISDFGLAMLYQDDRTHKETSIIAGTYGYMAPEYAMHGVYSQKLDVYAFGIMLLEIVTGRKKQSACFQPNKSCMAALG